MGSLAIGDQPGVRRRGHRGIASLALLGFNLLVVLFLLAPMLIVVVASFSPQPYLVFPPQGFSLNWYSNFVTNRDFVDALFLSIQLGIASAAIATVIGLAAATVIVQDRFRAGATVRSLLTAPLLVPTIVLGLGMLLYFSRLRLANTTTSLLFAHVVHSLPYVILIVGAGLQSFDRSIEDAARSMGASDFRAFVTVTLPLIKPSVIAGALFAFISSFDEVVLSLFLAGPRTTTLPVRIFQYIEFSSDPTIAAISTLLVLVTVVVVLLVDRYVGFSRIF